MNERLACRHLLRHINDAAALRKNALLRPLLYASGETAAKCFDARDVLALARRVLGEALQSLRAAPCKPAELVHRERQYHILLKCDLGAESHAEVASALGIGRRQFYRERTRACELLAEYLVERFHNAELLHFPDSQRVAGNARVVDIFALELNRAIALRHAAQFDRAAAQIERIIDSSENGLQRALALCAKADLLTDLQDFAGARSLLGNALDEVENCVPHDGRRSAFAIVHLARAALAEAQGDVAAVDSLCILAEHHARESLVDGPVAHMALARIELLLVPQNDMRGDAAAAARHLANARGALAETPYPQAHVIGEYFRRHLDHLVTSNADPRNVVETYTQALEIAEQNGLPIEASRVCSIYAAHLSLVGRLDEARSYLRRCLAMQALVGTQAYTDLLLAAADIECGPSGDPAAAIALARRAQDRLEPESLNWANSMLMQSMAQLCLGNYTGVLEPVSLALDAFRRLASPRYVGASMRVLAKAYDGLGRKPEANALIRDAIDQLRGRGNARQLSLAYSASAHITGSRAHAREARRLLQTM
ncbi:MAG: hypothetical protein ABI282_11465 [Candidatus Baltobacteraceae bacterium]